MILGNLTIKTTTKILALERFFFILTPKNESEITGPGDVFRSFNNENESESTNLEI